MACGCKGSKDPSAAQAKRQADHLKMREARTEAQQKFRAERQTRIQNQRRRPSSG